MGQLMKLLSLGLLATTAIAFNTAVAAAAGKEAYTADFTKNLSGQWRTIGGKWEVKDGFLRQTSPGRDDPTKACIVTIGRDDESSDLVVTAKLRLDFFRNGADARAGISVCTDPNSGRGLNLVFHDGKLQWLHDFVAWGPGRDFPYETGKWYWMKLSKSKGDPTAVRWIDEGKEPGLLKGKAWRDGEAEPADWMVLWSRPDDSVGGHPGLNGGSAGMPPSHLPISRSRG